MSEKKWQTKHITDEMVVAAVARYNAAMNALPKEGGPFGMSWLPRGATPPFPYEELAGMTGAPEKVTYAACERACDRDLIEFGVSLRTGWLTEKGKALLPNPPA